VSVRTAPAAATVGTMAVAMSMVTVRGMAPVVFIRRGTMSAMFFALSMAVVGGCVVFVARATELVMSAVAVCVLMCHEYV
jgi:hypothetical protein